jgi:hypothetical protein
MEAESGTSVFTFGYGKHGQLGHGTLTDELYPKEVGQIAIHLEYIFQVQSLDGRMVTQVACGGVFSAALTGKFPM